MSSSMSVWSSSQTDFPSDQQRSAASTPGIPSQHPPTLSVRGTGPIISLRARQIQADEGILAAPYRSLVRQASSSNDYSNQSGTVNGARRESEEDINSGGSRLFGRRARAGTLPSSFDSNNDQGQHPLRGSNGQQRHASGSDNAFDGANSKPWNHSSSQTGTNTPSIIYNGTGQEAFNGPIRATSASSSPLNGSAYSQQGLSPNAAYPSSKLVQTRGQRSNSALEYDQIPNFLPNLTSHSPTLITNSPSNPLDTIQDASRNRSGSKSGLGSSPFGPSLFNTTWSDTQFPLTSASRPSSSLSNTLAPSRPNATEDGNLKDVYETRRDSQSFLDHAGRQTLDYLGLDKDDAMNTRVGSGYNISQRNRASTLASVPRGAISTSSHSGSLCGDNLQYNEGRNERHEDFSDAQIYASYALEHGLDVSQLAAMASAIGITHPSNATSLQGRNRAGTIAALGGQGGRQQIAQELLKRMAASGQGANLNGLGIKTLIDSLQATSLGSDQPYGKAPMEGFPYLDIATPPLVTPIRSSPSTPATGLSGTNKSSSQDGQSYAPWGIETSNGSNIQLDTSTSSHHAATRSVHQVPTRSLWIGNLDSNTTGQELMRVFAPYGAIESLRLLPEKECGFVNFVDLNDAIQAREDVLGRLGAKLDNLGTGPAGTVRIGYGKIDSTPSGASFTVTPSNHTQLSAHLDTTSYATDNGLDSAPMSSTGSEGGVATRALWVGGIPASLTSATLLNIFQPFGPVESARILTHKNCAFINYERIEDAIRARKMLHGRDVLGSDVGIMKIGFAKVPVRNVDVTSNGSGNIDQPRSNAQMQSSRAIPIKADSFSAADIGMDNYRSNMMTRLYNQREQERQEAAVPSDATSAQLLMSKQAPTSSSSSIVPASDKGGVPLPDHMMPRPTMNDLQILMSQLSAGQADHDIDLASVAERRPSATYYMTIPLITEVSSGRRFETSRLREARRSIESGQLSMHQCDQLAREYQDAIVDLASDYIGNTLVQKFFEHGSEQVKMEMLQQLAPHLAMTGCHKNGTWAAQKILECCQSKDQIVLIAQHLRPYIPGLLLDQFGNYVVQCCLQWKQPINDFVFDAMVDRCWEIAQGRFGARSMRACLEKDSVTNQQRKRVAISIILNSVPLATSPNGSILLTWLMDTPALSKSYKLLAPRFSPHLTHLCTHKLASTPVLRIIGQNFEPEASQILLEALFESVKDQVLEEIVIDQVHGSQFITKVLSCSNLSAIQRDKYASQVHTLIVKHQLIGVPAYRRLCEDLGLLPPSLTTTTTTTTTSTSFNNERRLSPTINDPNIYASAAASTTPSRLEHQMQPFTGLRPYSNPSTLAPSDAFNPYWEATSPVHKHQHPLGRPSGLQ